MVKLIVWEKAHFLTLEVYRLTKSFPKEELFALSSQMKRAAISVPSNIMEGKARESAKDFKRFLIISRGSLEELKYQLLLAKDLRYINSEEYNATIALSSEVGKLLNGLINSIRE